MVVWQENESWAVPALFQVTLKWQHCMIDGICIHTMYMHTLLVVRSGGTALGNLFTAVVNHVPQAEGQVVT